MSKARTTMIYGDSGATKTTQAYFLAKYIHETTGLRGRFIGSNASDSAPFEDSGMIEKGIVDFFDIAAHAPTGYIREGKETYPGSLAALRWLSQGFWPRDTKDKEGKVTKHGHFSKSEKCITKDATWDKLGFIIIEGMAGISSLFLDYIRSQQEGVGFKHSFSYVEDGETIGGLQEGHYSIVQAEIYKMVVLGFACLPVKHIIWTSLVSKGENKRIGETVYGPKSAGQATTFEIPSWFMDCFHLDTVKLKKDKDSEEMVEKKVAWFIRHPDQNTNIDYLAKIRMMPESYPKLLEKFPNGFVQLGYKNGLDRIYREIAGIVENDKKEQAEPKGKEQ